ncbi:hypothetical protein EJB05_48739 [Eragrostis curvula]|uniref:Remorin C-terminal domain-containing protein n=1 Tax=Eragrostis curvula TaxID=38414 RepID=A0A5J9T2Q3_9POAL|nr:hypothetical protein EJB05_48739 [Eragrostis curvula]
MRVGGGGEAGSGLADKAVVVTMRRKAVAEEGESGGCSASSTSSGRGSSRGDDSVGLQNIIKTRTVVQPLTSYVRGVGRARTDLEPDVLLTSSSSYASAASTEPQEEEEDGASEGEKDHRWVHGRLQQPANNNGVPHPTGECQGQRHRQEAVLFHGRKDRTQRPASLDFGSPGVARSSTHSPGYSGSSVGVMNKGLCVSSHNRSDVLSSPGTPNYHRRGAAVVGYQQGCNSERGLPPASGHRRHPGSSMVLPPYNGGRTLPSKWEDAERWIFSPNPSSAPGRSVPQYWRPKSKSGPLGPPGRFGGPCSSVSSSAMFLESGRVGIAANSPFLAGVLLPEHDCGGSTHDDKDLSELSGDDSRNGQGCRSSQSNEGRPATLSTRISQQSESYQSVTTSHESIQEYNPFNLITYGSTQGAIFETSISACADVQSETTKDSTGSSVPVIIRKHVATQTSPDISRSTSPSTRPSFSRSLSAQQVKELENCFSKLEIRDVQIDDRVTLTRWSKKHVTRGSDKNSTNIIEWKKRTMESKSSAWEVTETAKCLSKIEGEEAKMTAWENMQKAKAEAAIQKLVIKLEKKRPYSLERIFNTLRSSHRKTQVVRSTATTNHDHQISRTIRTSNLNKNGQVSSLSGCFTCHAF